MLASAGSFRASSWQRPRGQSASLQQYGVHTSVSRSHASPGAQYSRLASLPRAYPLALTGLTRNGWVAVAIQDAELTIIYIMRSTRISAG